MLVSLDELVVYVEAERRVSGAKSQADIAVQGPVSRKPRKLFGPVKAFLVHLYLKTEKFIRLKLLV